MSKVIINNVEVHLVSRDGSIFANSLEVANVFEKPHKDVLVKIRSMSERAGRNFSLKYYQSSGKELPMYEMSRDGFMFLGMGFNGEKAENFKLDLIDAFNEMEQHIKEVPKLPTNPMEILQLIFDAQKATNIELIEIKDEIEELKGDIVLTPSQKRILQKSVATKVYSFNAPKDSNKKLFSKIYSKLKDKFVVSSYMEIPRLQFNEAKSMVDNITLIDLVYGDIMETIFPNEYIRVMLHALGISHTKNNRYIQPNTRYNPYPISYRNYYQQKNSEIFNKLVLEGLAEYYEHEDSWRCYYRVTEKGIEHLKSLGYKFKMKDVE
jgi:Rha family phage regulatory protein